MRRRRRSGGLLGHRRQRRHQHGLRGPERRGWTPTDMTHHDDTWHIAGTTLFDEDAHWGGPADDEPGSDERHEQGHVRAPSGEVPYDKDWDGVERAADKAEASLRLMQRVRSTVDTSRWWVMEWPVAAVDFLTTAMGASPDDRHKYVSRLRAITVKHMSDLWAAQVTRRREADDNEVMEVLKRQWNDVWKSHRACRRGRPSPRHTCSEFATSSSNGGASRLSRTPPKITQWLSTTARDPDSARSAANRLTTQQTQAGARASRSRRRAWSASRTAALQSTMQRWVRSAPNGATDVDQTPPEDDLQPENGVLGPATGTAREGTVAGTGHVAEANDTLGVDIDLGWLPEPGRIQALSGRAAAYDDTGRCAYHLSPFGCTLVDGDADGPGLIELCGLKPAKPMSVPPETPGRTAEMYTNRRRTTHRSMQTFGEPDDLVRTVRDWDPHPVRQQPRHRTRG